MASPVTFPTDIGAEKLGPGRYAVWRRFVLAGAYHARRLECVNPAYGYKVIAKWEEDIRKHANEEGEPQ